MTMWFFHFPLHTVFSSPSAHSESPPILLGRSLVLMLAVWNQRRLRSCLTPACGGGGLYSLSCVWLFVTPWTVAHQGPLSMGFSRQEYWTGLPFPPLGESSQPRDLPKPRVSFIGRQMHYRRATREAPTPACTCSEGPQLPPKPTVSGWSWGCHPLHPWLQGRFPLLSAAHAAPAVQF